MITKNAENNQDIYSVLESVGWIWRLFATIIYVPKGVVGNRKYVINKLLMVFNFLLSLSIFSSSFGLLFNDNLSEIIKGLGLDTRILISIKQTFNFLIILDMIFWKIFSKDKFIKVTDSLATQDKVLKVLGCRIDYKSDATKVRICIRLMFIMSLTLSFQEVYYGLSMSTLIDWSNWWLPSIIHRLSLSLFSCLVWMIGVRFNALNEKLNWIVVSSTSSHTQVFFNLRDSTMMLRTIANVHCRLCKIGEEITNIFIINLITCALETFISVTLMLYRFILETQHNKIVMTLVNNAVGIILSTTQIMLIVFMCNWTQKKAFAATKLLHKIKMKEPNRALCELIQTFSMQLLQQKLKFSVGGLFTLDPSLLQAIAGGITTYLVILIQFGDMDTILMNENES